MMQICAWASANLHCLVTYSQHRVGLRYRDLCCSAFASYAIGLAATILVMNYFSAAQPALLYIVPAVLGGVGIHALLKREFNLVSGLPCLAELCV